MQSGLISINETLQPSSELGLSVLFSLSGLHLVQHCGFNFELRMLWIFCGNVVQIKNISIQARKIEVLTQKSYALLIVIKLPADIKFSSLHLYSWSKAKRYFKTFLLIISVRLSGKCHLTLLTVFLLEKRHILDTVQIIGREAVILNFSVLLHINQCF